MTKAQIRALFRPGQTVRVTNHYITREDHPCFGTQTRTVAKVTTTSLWFTATGNVQWPRVDQVETEDGIVRLFGGGIGQQPTDLFLTIEL
jgi:hypothetical protein